MSTFCILLCLIFVSFCSVSLSSRYKETDVWRKSVGPIVNCQGSPQPIEDIIRTCYHRCLMDPEPKDRVSLMLHQIKKDLNGPDVIECSKVKITQSFTMTWSFSYIKGPTIREILPVQNVECEDAINLNCPSGKCNHREKDGLDEEYHYASTTTKSETTISLMTMPSILRRDGNVLKLSPLSSKEFAPIGDGKMKDSGKVYSWKNDYSYMPCLYDHVQKYGCDKYDGTDGLPYYMCAGGRFSITPLDKNEPDVDASCSGIKGSHEGYLYSKVDSAMDSDTHSRLSITKKQESDANMDYLRHKVQQIATHLDAEICHNQCEILSLEARVKTGRESVLRIGLDYFKTDSTNGSLTPCTTLHGCRLPDPKVFCGNPPRVGVICTGISGLWDPTTIELTRGGVCLKPDREESLRVSLGGRHYSVDDNLMITLNLSDIPGVYALGFSNLHQSGVQLTIEEIGKLRPEWVSNKEGAGGISQSTESDRKIDSPSFSLGATIIGYWKSIETEFVSLEHYIGGVVILIGCGIVAYGFWKLRIVALKAAAIAAAPEMMTAGIPLIEKTTRKKPASSPAEWI